MTTKYANKPVIEGLINTIAIGLTGYGVVQITTGNIMGYLPVSFGLALEVLKYWGRNKAFW